MDNSIVLVLSLMCFCFCFLKNGYSFDPDSRQELDMHTHIQLSSLLPSTVCNPSTTQGQGERQSSLNLVHRYGPCFQHKGGDKQKIPSQREILEQDQARVKWIHSRISKYRDRSGKKSPNAGSIPARIGISTNTLNYVVRVGFGTPVQYVSLTFDTGNEITWVQCDPFCQSGQCRSQKDPIFNAHGSITYANVSCSAPICSTFRPGTDPCGSSTCTFGIEYEDGSYSLGFASQETFTFTTSDVFTEFYFGCANNNTGLFGSVAGILGLDRNPLSFPSQTAYKYDKFFSYCIPSTPSNMGHLTIGNFVGYTKSAKFTPIPPAYKNSEFYGVEITGISYNGRNLTIPRSVFSNAGAVIDSGAVITRLPPDAYAALRYAFRETMAGYPMVHRPGFLLDSCYDVSKNTSVRVPAVSFFFGGDVEVKLDPLGIIYVLGKSTVCLAFSQTNGPFEEAIFGNVQQKTLEVVYDGLGERIGFAPRGCN